MGQLVDHALAIAFFEVVLAAVGVFLAFGQHGLDQSGEFVGSRGDGFALVHACAQAAKVGAERGFAGTQCAGREPQGSGGAVGTALGLAAHDFAAGDPGAWTQAHPRGEMLVAGGAAHVSAARTLLTGGKDNGAPALRPHQRANHYAAFVIDPDGHTIEALCHEPVA